MAIISPIFIISIVMVVFYSILLAQVNCRIASIMAKGMMMQATTISLTPKNISRDTVLIRMKEIA